MQIPHQGVFDGVLVEIQVSERTRAPQVFKHNLNFIYEQISRKLRDRSIIDEKSEKLVRYNCLHNHEDLSRKNSLSSSKPAIEGSRNICNMLIRCLKLNDQS